MKALMERVRAFNDDRDWRGHHDLRSLVLAICSEAGEVTHPSRWRRYDTRGMTTGLHAQVEPEVADILIFIFAFCSRLEINPKAHLYRGHVLLRRT